MTVAESLSPTASTRVRRSLFWVAFGVGALIIALVALALSGGGGGQSRPLQADSASPVGAKGLVSVLEQHGVSVTAAASAADAGAALSGSNDTLFVYDADGLLEADALEELTKQASDVVVLSPDFADLRAIAPGVLAGGTEGANADPVEARCDLPAASAAQTAEVELTYRITQNPDARGCFPVSDGRYGLVTLEHGDGSLTLLGNPSALNNESILHAGNAALALNLLGENDELVWYLPTLADVSSDAPPSLGELTPPWVVPFTVLLAFTAIAAMFWRGRRLGPVVVENLPVHVPARETVEGRARLYERGNTRTHAIDSIRIGALSRITGLLGLSTAASALQIADATASALSLDARETRGVLVDDVPSTDAELMTLSDAVNDLEVRVRAMIDETGRM